MAEFVTPDQIASRRRMAQALMMQGSSTEPVQHWAQVLARALQGGIGGYMEGRAREDEKSNQNAIVQALMANPQFSQLSQPEQSMIAANPTLLNSVAGTVYGNKFDPMATLRQQQAQAQIQHAQGQESRAAALHPLELQAKQRDLDAPPVTFSEHDPNKALLRRNARTGAVETVIAPAQSSTFRDHGQAVERTQEARKEFEAAPTIKSYREAQSSFDRLESLVKKSDTFGSGSGDIALVFNFIKALDPTSVVQPGEQATARNAPGVSDQVLNYYNRLLNGQFLTKQTREDFTNVIRSELEQRRTAAVALARRHRRIAKESGMPADHVVDRQFAGDDLDVLQGQNAGPSVFKPYTDRLPQRQPEGSASRQRAVNPTTGQVIEWDGSKWVPVR